MGKKNKKNQILQAEPTNKFHISPHFLDYSQQMNKPHINLFIQSRTENHN